MAKVYEVAFLPSMKDFRFRFFELMSFVRRNNTSVPGNVLLGQFYSHSSRRNLELRKIRHCIVDIRIIREVVHVGEFVNITRRVALSDRCTAIRKQYRVSHAENPF